MDGGADRPAGDTSAGVDGVAVWAAVTVKVGRPALALRSVAELRRKTSVPMASMGATVVAAAFEAGGFKAGASDVILAGWLQRGVDSGRGVLCVENCGKVTFSISRLRPSVLL